ncbi:hypothetical protein ACFV97_06660 [Streptomyces sp. NPDC059913]|uniref:hypothetical protein n=1 Tax=unclassified Streptomyces TaxID=2593676 RepID=UPI003656C0A6
MELPLPRERDTVRRTAGAGGAARHIRDRVAIALGVPNGLPEKTFFECVTEYRDYLRAPKNARRYR